jgi:hypothetical protein
MRKMTFKVHQVGFQKENDSLARLVDIELELGEINAERFLIDPRQELLWDTWRFCGTSLSFDDWLTKCGKWDKEAKMFKFVRGEAEPGRS